MSLRPLSFSIPSTTELKVTFSDDISESVSTGNFEIESLNGAVNDLEVIGISIDKNIVIIKTRPQVSGNYYLLKFLDTNEVIFESKKGDRLFDDSVSRELFFVGIDDINPFRDRMFENLPHIFEIENTNLKDIYSSQAKEFYQAQKSIGEVLSNNYLSVEVIDEPRTRTAGAKDRLANENAYEITRVSKFQTNSRAIFDTLDYTSSNRFERHQALPAYPVSLQETAVVNEEISIDTENNSFSGFLINLANKNVIKLLSIKLIKNDDVEDCDNNIGTLYNIEKYKYTIKDNFYDQDFAFEYNSLESNQILLSEFGNLERPQILDTIIVSYLYKNLGKYIIEDEVDVSRVESILNEAVPSVATRFFLKHAPIVNINNAIPSRNGVQFKFNENSEETPEEFRFELAFNFSKLPSKPGEFSINYETGEVFVYGDSSNLGTNDNNYVAEYLFRKTFERNLDYSIFQQDLVALPNRDISNSDIEIDIRYEVAFAEGSDFDFSSHIEVMPEFVENRLSQSFGITTKHAPITNVFRILNQTTGEVYNPLFISETEILFSGNRSPEIKNTSSETSNFLLSSNEELKVIGEFIIPAFSARITSNISNNSIGISPGIPAELISLNSEDYFIRQTEVGSEVIIEDTQIRFFGDPDSNNLINTLSISLTADAPSLNSEVIIGTRGYIVSLEHELILNKNLDSLGALTNTSIGFDNLDIFQNEKNYISFRNSASFSDTSSGGIKLALISDKNSDFSNNMSLLRKVGDYGIDYRFGIIYISVGKDQELNIGNASYSYGTHQTKNKNILTSGVISKKINAATAASESAINYGVSSHDVNTITIHDLDCAFTYFDGETLSPDADGSQQLICQVLDNYTVIVPHNIIAINGIFDLADLNGYDLSSTSIANRHQESSSSVLSPTVLSGGKNIYDSTFVTFDNNIIDLKKNITKKVAASGNDFYVNITELYFDTLISVKKSSTGELIPSNDITYSYSNNILQVTVSDDAVSLSTGDSIDVSYVTSLIPSIGTTLSVDYRFGSIFFDYSNLNDEIVVWYEYGDNELDWSINSSISEGEQYFVSYKYGALRDALRTNFGSLTNIPQLNNFSLSTDRELYRDALIGVLQSFPKGPTIPAYNDLIKSFTKINPNITESAFGSWILGRDYLNQGKINYKGNLEFAAGKFEDGLMFNDDIVVNIPAVSSLSLKEGTLEAWIRPNWSGISNDANLTFNLEHIGLEKFSIKPHDNPFDKKWDLLPIEESVGSSDSTGTGTTLFNYKNDDAESSGFNQGKFGIYKNLSNLTRLTDSELKIKTRIEFIGQDLNGINKVVDIPSISAQCEDETPDDLFYLFGRHPSSSFLAGPWSVSDILPDDIYPAETMFISDGYKLSGFSLNLSSLTNFDSVSDFDLLSDEIDNFDGPHASRQCRCTISNSVDNLSNFNNLSIDIEFLSNFDLLSILGEYNIIDNSSKSFMIMDSNNSFFQIIGFYDQNNKFVDHIPSFISKIVINKFNINNSNLNNESSSNINDNLPIGTLHLMAKVATILTKNNYDNSTAFFGFSKQHIINWSEYHQFSVSCEPLNNIVNYKIDDFETSSFYTESFGVCNLNMEFTSSLNGFVVGQFSESTLSSFNILNLSANVENRFGLNDIYIGKDAFNPFKNSFKLNKNNYPNSPIGEPHNMADDEGIFIWFDEFCRSPISTETGQWIFRTKSFRFIDVPVDVSLVTGGYSNIYSTISLEDIFSGEILTDGEFSSVVRSHRDEITGLCNDGLICNAIYRYCGNDLLEDRGWVKLEDSNSDLVNTVVGGMETQLSRWTKFGNFNTSVSSGIYRLGPSSNSLNCKEQDNNLGNIIYTTNPCPEGDFEYLISLKISQFDSSIVSDSLGEFSYGNINGNYTGITPICINDGSIYIIIALALSKDGEPLIVFLDGQNYSILDIISYSWNDTEYHEYRLEKNKINGTIKLYIDDLLLNQLSVNSFITPNLAGYLSEEFISIGLIDNNLIDVETYSATYLPNIADIDLIFFSGIHEETDGYLESNDFIINTDDRIQFEFHIDSLDFSGDGYDGYDGYSVETAIDEMFIISDKLRYIVDSGVNDHSGRFSIFKDGKGFLNFQIIENSMKGQEPFVYNLATNIKDFVAGDLHHVAASWKLNSIEENDQMHLFIDGQEVPNIYKFGGKIPVRINDKFSDVSKEVLHNFSVRDVDFCQEFSGGTITAGSETFNAGQPIFEANMIGRSIMFTDSTVAPTLINKEYIISSFIDSERVTLTNGSLSSNIEFQVSTTDISFKFPPIAGMNSPILTDLRNSKFAIFRTDSSQEIEEFGGILYEVSGNEISILSGTNITHPKFRANVDTRIIEFIEQDELCDYIDSVDFSDINIHIKTFGLNIERVKNTLILAGSSYLTSDGVFENQSVVRTTGAEPVSLSDVSITRLILNNYVILTGSVDVVPEQGFLSEFTIDLTSDSGNYKLTSESGILSKNNLGRLLTLHFDSDNINFCNFESDEDGYQDGYLDNQNNTITIYGSTTDGVDEETLFINKNGDFETSKYFTSVTSISGSIIIIDSDYSEVGVVSLRETNPITTSDNNGIFAEIYRYLNGHFIITEDGSDGETPFEIHRGYYLLDYPAYLKVKLSMIGDKLYIGSDIYEQNQFGGTIDEFRIINQISGDTRITEITSSDIRSVTNDYNLSIPYCPDSKTLALLPLNNPIQLQSRRLKNKEFLNLDKNIKFKLTKEQRSELIKYSNNEFEFVSKMINFDFNESDSIQTFIEVHHAENGPLFNLADYYRNSIEFPLNDNSVNSNFGKSAYFNNGSGISLNNNDGKFRNKEGTIEFWVSPVIDSIIDTDRRFYLDIFSSKVERITSTTPTLIELPNPASKIDKITLISKTKEFSEFYEDSEELLFDEVKFNQISGKLSGGTGVRKDFSINHKLSSDGRKIFLSDSLPGDKIDILVSYLPLNSSGDRVSIFKDEFSKIVFAISADGIDNVTSLEVDWKKNTWHKIVCTYKTGTRFDFIKLFVDGQYGDPIVYGEELVFGDTYQYGKHSISSSSTRNTEFTIPLNNDFKIISVGSDVYGDHSAKSRIDNLRLSRINRAYIKNIDGEFVDTSYSSNLNTILPVVSDDSTTLLLDFDEDGEKIDKFAQLIDPNNGIFNFDIEVVDNFDKVIGINDGEIEELISKLVNRIKPAHTNAIVKFTKNRC